MSYLSFDTGDGNTMLCISVHVFSLSLTIAESLSGITRGENLMSTIAGLKLLQLGISFLDNADNSSSWTLRKRKKEKLKCILRIRERERERERYLHMIQHQFSCQLAPWLLHGHILVQHSLSVTHDHRSHDQSRDLRDASWCRSKRKNS